MERYINAERLKEWFRARDKDLFSVETICAVVELFPESETLGGEFGQKDFARYTEKDVDGAYVSIDFAWENGCAEVRGGAINELARYEDTGLTPLEVMKMAKEKHDG
jgi:hypothetical protein